MATDTPENLPFAQLAAHADGKLDPAAVPGLQDAVGGEAELSRLVQGQVRLRAACAQAMDRPEHRCPDELKADLMAQFGANTADSDKTAPPAVAGRIGMPRWLAPLAAAAVIAIGTVSAVQVMRGLSRPAPQAFNAAQLISQSMAQHMEQRHLSCAADPAQLFKNELFPQSLDTLDAKLAETVHASLGTAALDLSTIGYTYRGAGVCTAPGPGAVHVVYANAANASLSLWLRAHDGTLDLEPGRLYGPPADSPQAGRILIWLDGDVLMHLVGELPADLEQAKPLLHAAAI